jgi:hypothetical protein
MQTARSGWSFSVSSNRVANLRAARAVFHKVEVGKRADLILVKGHPLGRQRRLVGPPAGFNSSLLPVCSWFGPLSVAHSPIFSLGGNRTGIIWPERQYPNQAVFMLTALSQ